MDAFFLTVWNIIVFLLVLTAIISIHELGHFLFAKRAKILCHEFSIGMGPLIVQKKKGETFYSLRAIPLGGYVAMSGENGDNPLIAKGSRIGINLNENGKIFEMVLDETIAKPQMIGEVLDFDLYGKNFAPLFIELDMNGEVKRFEVERNAMYLYRKKQKLQVTPAESSFGEKTLWERFLVLFAGPAMNFILALVILFIVAIIQGKAQNTTEIGTSGIPELQVGDVITELGGTPVSTFNDIVLFLDSYNQTTLTIKLDRDGTVVTETIELYVVLQNLGFTVGDATEMIVGQSFGKAQQADLDPGDKIVGLTYGTLVLEDPTWEELIAAARNTIDGGSVKLFIERDGESLTIEYNVLGTSVLNDIGADAVMVQIPYRRVYAFDFVHMLVYPWTQFGDSVKEMGVTLGLLFNPSSGVGVGDLAGPVGIFSLVSNAASAGFVNLMIFVAFLSVNIGLMNLLPIPALDGGRLIFLGYEAVTRRKIPNKVEMWVNNIFFILLMVLFVFVTWNDIVRLFA